MAELREMIGASNSPNLRSATGDSPDALQARLQAVERQLSEMIAVAYGARTLIQDIDKIGADGTFIFTSIPPSYKLLKLIGVLRGTNASVVETALLTFNGDTGANYYAGTEESHLAFSSSEGLGASNIAFGRIVGDGGTAHNYSAIEIDIPNYASANIYKPIIGKHFSSWDTASTHQRFGTFGGLWASLSAITQIDIKGSGAANFKQYSHLTLYGFT